MRRFRVFLAAFAVVLTAALHEAGAQEVEPTAPPPPGTAAPDPGPEFSLDRKSTRLNSSH